ncbi:uncharacterized protein LOC125559018 [Nematostella vectensis]|uniref:uncharacterized protein LOC125559018 n=1 Tax=Nematostella vectensis TaxID=45351 RepID=UPI002076F4AD|nr:uncharacterized protein LOC125559018 [Nematostella vectensis]
MNRPIVYPERPAITDGSEAAPKEVNVDVGNDFTDDDRKILSDAGLPLPSVVWDRQMRDDTTVSKMLGKRSKLNQDLGKKKGRLSVTKKSKKKHADVISRFTRRIDVKKRYRDRLGSFGEGEKMAKSGKGLYNQPKRNAYKISQNGRYGTLKIDVPKLMGNLRLIAHKDGQKVYDKRVDLDTIYIITKRFKSSKKYSDLSRMVFNELNELGELPIHRTSKKYSKIGSGVVYYNDPKDLLSRLELLGGSIQAGNDSVKGEFSEVAHVLRRLGVISNDQLGKLLSNYLV